MSLRSLNASGQVICPPPTQMHKALATPEALGNHTQPSWKSSPASRARKSWGGLGSPGLGGQVPTVSEPQSGSRRSPGRGGPHVAEALLAPPPNPPEKKSQSCSQNPCPQTGWVGAATEAIPPRATAELSTFTGVNHTAKPLT